MHERERHRMILSAIEGRSVATVQDFAALTGASEATVRRDIALLDSQKKLRRVRGGAEALKQALPRAVSGESFGTLQTRNASQKLAIAREAARLCEDDSAIIINGGSTTFGMVHYLTGLRLQVLTNSFPIAEHLLQHSQCGVLLPAGAVYREQGLILSPFDADGIAHFRARRMFMGAQGISPLGFAESDPLIIQSEQRLMRQADELVILADASKFADRSSFIIAPLERADILITDERIDDRSAAMIESAGLRLIVAVLEPKGEPPRSES
ncbi:DeoR faimly transcriptional regulator [Aureimonas ureilytica]|uniref:DeoR faimly transcriptional regulator n=1 Tax=Aureimonas ureilytica TaxID=401562 RepID=A0A175RRD7_9HYPH|nr:MULTISPECIES: DeoR/GlpR family DNA-binding transcription regulator [Aureimonas]KTR05379.1 DeoR faimly transcriptional regulator [Aureimonas ureilytica]